MKSNDPHHQREAEKYENPIPSREMILSTLNDSDHPLDFLALATELGLSDETDLSALKNRLRAMERDGQMLFNRRKQYIPVKRTDLIAGRVQGHADGFGFLIPDDDSDDLFLHAKQMRGVMHGDRVLASVRGIDRKGRREGNVVEVLERGTEQVVGRFMIENGIPLVVPDNSRISQDILIPPDQVNDAKPGQIVVAGIMEQPTRRSQPVGRIVEVLGDHMAPGMEIGIALRSHDLPFEWPAEVTAEAGTLGSEVPESSKTGRLDLRNTPLVTIDGEDARDFDDAVYCERQGDHWRLLVAIADVSSYVKPGSALDKEAVLRATSVYFPGEVIPMLPEALSNGLCSLNPAVDRLCMVCEAHIDDNGDVLSYQFHEGIMHSAARLTYTRMADIVVEKDKKLRGEYSKIVSHLDDLYKLYHVLREQRSERGAIDFETTETRIVFGEDRKISEIVPTIRNDAHKIIEECMILANVCAARFLKKHNIPALHRVHDLPKADKLEDVRTFLNGVGLSLGGGMEPEPADYARVLSSVQGRQDAHLIQTVLLRSLSQAVYSPDTIGHFGLAQEDYAHFTSPIRRYPDLLVHRAIRHIVQGNKADTFTYSTKDMVALGKHCSMAERRADDASRDVVSWLKCEYMQEHVGGSYDGIITAVTSFGLFVELNDIYVEGLVHVTALTNDYYKFDPIRHRLTGESSGRAFRLGDVIKVKVARVDLDERKIDFVLEESGEKDKDKPKPSKSKKFKGKSRKKKPSK